MKLGEVDRNLNWQFSVNHKVNQQDKEIPDKRYLVKLVGNQDNTQLPEVFESNKYSVW